MSALRNNAARLVSLVSFLALAVTACEHNAMGVGALATIEVVRNPETLVIGTSAQFTAIGRDANGTVVGINPTWTAASGGTIGGTGVFTAGTVPGTFTNSVTATVGSISGSATAIVLAGPPASIVLTPTPVTLATGATQQFTAVVSDVAGNVLPNLPNWSVAAGGGGIGSAGLFTAGNTAGTFTNTVVASIGGISASGTVTVSTGPLASITVTPNPVVLDIGQTQQYTAVGRDANGNLVAFTPTWAVVASGGTIDPATGLFTAGAVAGTFANTIRACSTAACGTGTIRGFATVTVNAGPLATITVTPNPVSVGTDANQQFAAVGRDANGNIVGILPVWTVDAGDAGGTILQPSGVYTAPGAVGVGFDTVRATVGSISGPAHVDVVASGTLASISVTPNPATVVVNGSVQMTATGFDNTGVVVPIPVGMVWSVVPPGGGTISATGLFTAGNVVGLFTNSIRATSGSVIGAASANVTSSPTPGPSLGAAETHGLLAGSTFTCVTGGTINADASVWPGTANSGFPPCVITGQERLGTPDAQIAQGDLTTAYLALAAMPCGTTITADLGGTTLAPGVYCSGSSVGVTGTVTLDGNGDLNALFVIRAPSTLTTAGNVVLQNGAQAKNVYWWVGSSATIGVSSQWQGNIIAFTSITLNDNATLLGRALARNGAVTLGTNNTITLPSP
ncbi:MAG: ice-binding family protein [Gemmatimonadaceae bacterium]